MILNACDESVDCDKANPCAAGLVWVNKVCVVPACTPKEVCAGKDQSCHDDHKCVAKTDTLGRGLDQSCGVSSQCVDGLSKVLVLQDYSAENACADKEQICHAAKQCVPKTEELQCSEHQVCCYC